SVGRPASRARGDALLSTQLVLDRSRRGRRRHGDDLHRAARALAARTVLPRLRPDDVDHAMTPSLVRARAASAAAILAAGAVLIGCGSSSPQTGIVAEISSDLPVPGAFDEVHVTVTTTAGASLYEQSFSLAGGSGARVYALPLRVGVQPQGDATAPFR